MKKLFLTLMALVTSMAALATDYTGTLTVTVNGETTVQDNVTVSVVGNGNDYTLSINNFIMEGIPVGNIVVTAPGTTDNGLTSIVSSQNINISAGEDPGIDETDWLGPELGEVPINMVLAFNEFAMTTNIDIFLKEEGFEQRINVKFAQDGELTGYQIKNSGFEKWTASSGEPDHWHGFKSATGTWADRAKGTLEKSEDKHSGEYSALITSGSVFGIINNGTMTTGRLNAGSMSASNTANHSEMNMVQTDPNTPLPTDYNGDPFFAVMHGRPDAIKFWVKFSQGTANSSFPYATMSAIITDGSYYQDPEDKDYDNKLATATNNTIETCGWTEFTVPFSYIDKSITGEGVLVTFSTNATAGKGSSGDQVWIDDIAMVYNAAITEIKIKGTPLAGFAQDVYEYNFELPAGTTFTTDDIDATYVSEHAYLVKKVVETDEAVKLFVAVVSNDLNTIKVYTINYAKPKPQTVVLDGVSFAAGRNWATWYGDQPLQRPENVSVYTVTYNGGNTVTIPARTLSYIPAGVGVLLYSTTPATEVTALPYDGSVGSPTSALQGFLVDTPISNGYVLFNGTFILSESGTLAAHRCYLPVVDVDNAPRVLMIANEGTVTGIESLEAVDHGAARYFDINGREVNGNAKGVIIVRYSDGTVTKMINR